MTVKIIAFAILAISLSMVSSFPHRETLDCKGKPNGVYPDPDDNRGYYVCMDHLPFVHLDCNEGEHFDDSFKTCVKDVPTDGEEDISEKYVSNQDEDIDNMKEEVMKYLENENVARLEGNSSSISHSNYKIYNVQFTENVFPESVVIIGKMNREQKNK